MPTTAEAAFDPDVIAIASEAFCRSWHFAERDPVLAGYDHDVLRAELARSILSAASHGERDALRMANHAISGIRGKVERAETIRWTA